jgi:hypothetical protein
LRVNSKIRVIFTSICLDHAQALTHFLILFNRAIQSLLQLRHLLRKLALLILEVVDHLISDFVYLDHLCLEACDLLFEAADLLDVLFLLLVDDQYFVFLHFILGIHVFLSLIELLLEAFDVKLHLLLALDVGTAF